MRGLFLHVVVVAVAATGLWLCARKLLELDARYAEPDTVSIRSTPPVLATAPAPVPPPREPELAAAPTPASIQLDPLPA